MKLLVFAHTPPPHHGQSYMVQLMLAGFGGDHRRLVGGRSGKLAEASLPSLKPVAGIECYHVNARLSQNLEDIGDLRVGKFILLLGYCLQAIWCRFRYGVTTLYYIPAPGKLSALYRDWLVMFFCRPFFKRVVLHWHAAGLAKWLEMVVQMRSRSLTYRLMRQVDLSIVLSRYNEADARKLFSRQIQVVSNGIPDPCPEYARDIQPRRQARLAARAKLRAGLALSPAERAQAGEEPEVVKVLYLAHCTHEKGLFDTVAAVRLANQQLAAQASPLKFRLLAAGTFVTPQERAEFEQLAATPDGPVPLEHFGFVSGEKKSQLLRQADLFCFPTYYQNENQPVNLIEAMAYGLPILTTRWRSIPELFPPDYVGLVDIRAPGQIADALIRLIGSEAGESFRILFLQRFTLDRHLASLAEALTKVER